jgi:hypothetical protein
MYPRPRGARARGAGEHRRSRAGRHRERVCPVPLYLKSGLPITIASAALIRSTAAASSSGMKSAQVYEPEVCAHPWFRSDP